jgi:energy-coupling factor transport system ATP-binding protein
VQAPIVALQYPELQVFQERAADEVAYAAVSRGIDRETALGEARRCLERLELRSDFLDRSAWSLSTGEKRLLELVGALIAPSSLVILDEPTAGLDPVRKAALSRLVRERSMKSSVLVAGQDLPWVEGLGGTIVRLGD